MNEVRFAKLNNARWKSFEEALGNPNIDPDYMAELYIELTDDLSYSQTFFPKSKTTKYLNQLTIKGHRLIFARTKKNRGQLKRFFSREYPILLYTYRRYLFYAFTFFMVAVMIGVYSLSQDESFVRTILGDAYVNKTLDNIESGDPLGIYDSMPPVEMFFMIAWNNIRVSFLALASGLLLSIGTILLLFSNGIMLGTFQYFFIQKGLAKISFLTIWLHGTVEIFAIIVAGAAGLILGNSILFPGTYTRMASLKKKGMDAVKIVIGLIPFFIFAALIESFLTRYSTASYILDAIVIGISILIILVYFFIYPFYINKKINE